MSEKKGIKHSVLSKTGLSVIIPMLLVLLIETVVTSVESLLGVPGEAVYFSVVILMILVMAFHKLWFRREYKSSICFKYIRLDVIIVCIIVIVSTVVDIIIEGGFDFSKLSLMYISLALFAGFNEEVIFRNLPISLFMRNAKMKGKIYFIAILTALIFGFMHLTNAMLGADLAYTMFQVFFACCMGFLYAAIYLNTGNILLTIILHSFNDILAFAQAEVEANGAIIQGGVTISTMIIDSIMSVLYVAIGIILLRKSNRDRIIVNWKEIWNQN